jgi:hypothetical protein
MARGVAATYAVGWLLLAAPVAAAEWLVAPLPSTDPVGMTASPSSAPATWPVELRLPGADETDELLLWLPDGRRHSVVVDRIETRIGPKGERTTFWGRVDPWKLEHGYLVGTASGGRQVATIAVDGGVYRVLPAPAGTARGGLLTTAAPVADCDGTLADHALPRRGAAATTPAARRPVPTTPSAATTGAPARAAAPPVIDVLVLYTVEARQRAGDAARIELEIQHAIDYANAVFANSQVPARVALAGVREIGYQESRTAILDDLVFLATSAQAAAAREEVRADVMGLVKAACAPGCGIAAGMSREMMGTATAPIAVFVSALEAMPLNFTHELGHDLGCQHEPEHAAPAAEAIFPFAFAHYVPGTFRTVMEAFQGACDGCPVLPQFSNPALEFGGQPTGIPGQRDNARAVRAMAPTVATFGSLRGRIRVAAATVTTPEGATELVLDVYRTDGSIGAVSVDYATRNGSARAGQDFVATSGRLSWGTGEGDVLALAAAGVFGSNRRIVIPLLDDDRPERDETFTILLRKPRGGAKLGAAQVKVTLVDDDPGGLAGRARPASE